MTTPDVPRQVELSIELPGTPEQVWDAVASANGLSSWMFLTDPFEGFVGERTTTHQGPTESHANITIWEPPSRFGWAEEGWADMFGFDTPVGPMVAEFVIEAKSGGTCVLNVSHGFLGTGAEWEDGFIQGAEGGWPLYLDNLRIVLTNFAGRTVTQLNATAQIPGTPEAVLLRIAAAIGAGVAGEKVEVNGIPATVARTGDGDIALVLDGELPGYLTVFSWPTGEGVTTTGIGGYLFDDAAPAFVEANVASFTSWIKSVAADPGRLGLSFSVEVDGTPEQVWRALATEEGLLTWSLPTDIEGRVGGALCIHMGPEMSSNGRVTGWDPPHRLEYEEFDWAALAGQDPATVDPIVSEFVVEATSGGTCVVHVVSAAMGAGAEWEQAFFDDMALYWEPMFHNLQLALAHFRDEPVAVHEASVTLGGEADNVWSMVLTALGGSDVGASVTVADGLVASIERVSPGKAWLLLDPGQRVSGYIGLWSWAHDEDHTVASCTAYLFGPTREPQPPVAWQEWLDGITAGAGRPAGP